MLKASYFIAPAVALVAVVAWNIHQHRTVKTVEEETTEWERRVGERRSANARAEERPSGDSGKASLASPGGALDWRSISARIAAMEDSLRPEDMQAMMDLNNRIGTMGDSELISAIEEIESLGLGEDELEVLQEMLIEPLIERNPQLALERFSDRIEDDPDGIGWQLSFAMTEWAATDATAAAAWLDRQIADGTFESKTLDGRSEARLEFEAALLGELLDVDPEAAARRVAALAEDERREMMEQITFTDLDETGQRAYADLIRGLVPKDERAGSFAYLVEDIVPDGGYRAVDEFLTRVEATPAERAVAARQAVSSWIEEVADERSVTSGDIEELRGWLSKHDAESVDRMTGRAIADATQDCSEFPFEEADRLAREYFSKSGNVQVIVAFLESFAARSNLEQALPLAELIPDAAQRERVLKRLK